MDIHRVGAVADGVGKLRATQQLLAREPVEAAGMPCLAHAQRVGKGDDMKGGSWEDFTSHIGVGALQSATFEHGCRELVGVGCIHAVEAGAEDIVEITRAGVVEDPRCGIGGGKSVIGGQMLHVSPELPLGIPGFQAGKSRDQSLHVDGLEDFGFPGGVARTAKQITIAGGVDEDPGRHGAAAGFVLDDGRIDAIPFADSGSEPRTEEKPDAVFADERIEFKGEFRAVEAELPPVHRRDFRE